MENVRKVRSLYRSENGVIKFCVHYRKFVVSCPLFRDGKVRSFVCDLECPLFGMSPCLFGMFIWSVLLFKIYLE